MTARFTIMCNHKTPAGPQFLTHTASVLDLFDVLAVFLDIFQCLSNSFQACLHKSDTYYWYPKGNTSSKSYLNPLDSMLQHSSFVFPDSLACHVRYLPVTIIFVFQLQQERYQLPPAASLCEQRDDSIERLLTNHSYNQLGMRRPFLHQPASHDYLSLR